MGLLSFFKKSSGQAKASVNPYNDDHINVMYNLLFCDNPELYKASSEDSNPYPWDILFSETSTIHGLQQIIDDNGVESRMKILAYNRQRVLGHQPGVKELLGVIVEVGLDNGLDVLASFGDGSARYINQTGRILVWDTTDSTSDELMHDLFAKSREIIGRIGPWDKARRPAPVTGNVRITFLVSDGLYFGEGPMKVMFSDPIAAPALTSATNLMQYLTTKE